MISYTSVIICINTIMTYTGLFRIEPSFLLKIFAVLPPKNHTLNVVVEYTQVRVAKIISGKCLFFTFSAFNLKKI